MISYVQKIRYNTGYIKWLLVVKALLEFYNEEILKDGGVVFASLNSTNLVSIVETYKILNGYSIFCLLDVRMRIPVEVYRRNRNQYNDE